MICVRDAQKPKKHLNLGAFNGVHSCGEQGAVA